MICGRESDEGKPVAEWIDAGKTLTSSFLKAMILRSEWTRTGTGPELVAERRAYPFV
jgi:hypothetical protein